MVSRKRRRDYPENVPLAELVLQGRWTQTIDEIPENFLVTDNGDERERVIVFGSPACLRAASMAERWFMDGNFGIAPPGFSQLYIIRVPVGESAITAIYALLQRKTQASYEQLLRAVVNGCAAAGLQQPAPASVHCDFELAMHQAIRQVLPQANIRGCFYHLTQVNKCLQA